MENTNPSIETAIRQYEPCGAAADYLRSQPDWAAAWENCTDLSWLIWAVNRIGGFDAELRLFACACVRETPLADGRRVWDLLTDERSRNAVEVAERYARGEATHEELDAAAADAAADAAARWAAAADAAADARWAAADAAAAAAAADADADARWAAARWAAAAAAAARWAADADAARWADARWAADAAAAARAAQINLFRSMFSLDALVARIAVQEAH